MTKKIFSFLLFIMLVVGFAGINLAGHKAQAADFPDGCSSALGYSTTTGSPCNGTINSPIIGFLPGCTSALGYSTTNGVACSGSSVAILMIAGCSNSMGYSTETGVACNGTAVATPVVITPLPPTPTPTPGLPLTGFGGNAQTNINSLLALGIIISLGALYFVRKPRVSK